MNIDIKNIIIENNIYNEKFFKKYPKYSEAVKQKIYDNIVTIIRDMPYKIKPVHGYKYKNKVIEEYKIVLDKIFKCRVAYILMDDSVYVFFISTTLIKAEFTKLVSKVKGVERSNRWVLKYIFSNLIMSRYAEK